MSEEEEGEVASVGYRYRKWNLNNGVVSIGYILYVVKVDTIWSFFIKYFVTWPSYSIKLSVSKINRKDVKISLSLPEHSNICNNCY